MLGMALTGAAVLGRRAAAFDPAALGGLLARYEAGQGLFQDTAGTVPAAAGASVGRWSDLSGSGHHLVQAASANRPTARVTSGRASVLFGGTHWLDLPAGLQVDKRGSTLLAVYRSKDAATQAIWHMPAGATAHALYFIGASGAGELRFFNEASRNSLIASSHGTAVIAAVNRPGEVRLQLSGEVKTGLAASAGGTAAGGWVGQWNSGNFRLRAHLSELLLFGRALSDAEIGQVVDHLAAKHGALRPSEDRYLAFEGDSITQGVGASNADEFGYPAQLVRRLSRQPKWINLGAGGDTIQNMVATVGVLTGQLGRNLHYARRLCVLLAGTNDINGGRTEAQVIGDIDAWIAAVRAADVGAVLVGCTILPRVDFDAGEEPIRQAVNAHIRTAAAFNFVVDLAAEARLANPADGAIYGDGIHPTDAGYAILAELVHGALAARGYD